MDRLNGEGIDAVAASLAGRQKLKHIADEVRGAVWEFFLSFPKQSVSASNPSLQKWVSKSLGVSAAFSEVSENREDSEGDAFSLVDLVAANEQTAETLLLEREAPPEAEDEDRPHVPPSQLLSARALITWREEVILRLRDAGLSNAEIGHQMGYTRLTVIRMVSDMHRRWRQANVPQAPADGKISLGRMRIGPICLRRK